MNKKKIIVFGAGGFIGTYLIDELLKQNYEVTASDINQIGELYYRENKIPYVHVDITNKNDFENIKQVQYDAVIHLAAHQPANVNADSYAAKDYINVNVIGTLNILEFCKKNNAKKIIYASSHRNTQGLWIKNKAISEEDGRSIKYNGEYSMFSISESAAQDCVEHYRVQYGLNTIIFRLPPVYGYGPHTEIFKDGKPIKTGFQIFIDNAKACIPLKIWGDSNKGRDIIYVKDVVSAFIKAINNDKAQGLYNITSGHSLSLREQAEITAKIFWGNNFKPEIIELPDKNNDIESFLYDISKAKRELNWTPQYNFEAMLLDYQKEMETKKFDFLVKKRKILLEKK